MRIHVSFPWQTTGSRTRILIIWGRTLILDYTTAKQNNVALNESGSRFPIQAVKFQTGELRFDFFHPNCVQITLCLATSTTPAQAALIKYNKR